MLAWAIHQVSDSECPVSAITQRSYELVELVSSLESLNKSVGSAVPADQMPGYLLDAIRICRAEEVAAEAAEIEAASR